MRACIPRPSPTEPPTYWTLRLDACTKSCTAVSRPSWCELPQLFARSPRRCAEVAVVGCPPVEHQVPPPPPARRPYPARSCVLTKSCAQTRGLCHVRQAWKLPMLLGPSGFSMIILINPGSHARASFSPANPSARPPSTSAGRNDCSINVWTECNELPSWMYAALAASPLPPQRGARNRSAPLCAEYVFRDDNSGRPVFGPMLLETAYLR